MKKTAAVLVVFAAAVLVAAVCDFGGTQTRFANLLLARAGAHAESARLTRSGLEARGLQVPTPFGKLDAEEAFFESPLKLLFGKIDGGRMRATLVFDLSERAQAAHLPDISNFSTDISTEFCGEKIDLRADIKKLSFGNAVRADATARILVCGREFLLIAKGGGGSLSAKISENGSDVFLLGGRLDSPSRGSLKLKLLQSNGTAAEKFFGVSLPFAEAYAETDFDLRRKFLRSDITAKIDADSHNPRIGTLNFECKMAAELDAGVLKIGAADASLVCGGGLSARFAGERAKFSIPPRGGKIKLGRLSAVYSGGGRKNASGLDAESAGMLADVFLDENFKVFVKSAKPANAQNISLFDESRAVFERLTLMCDFDAQFDFPAQRFGASTKIYPQQINGKKFEFSADFDSDFNLNANAKIDARGSVLPLLASVNSVGAKSDANAEIGGFVETGDGVKISDFSARIFDNEKTLLRAETELLEFASDSKIPVSGKLKAEFENLPFAVFKPLFGDFDARSVSGKFEFSADTGTAKMDGVFSADDVSAYRGAARLFSGLDVKFETRGTFDFAEQIFDAKVEKIKVSNGRGTMADCHAKILFDARKSEFYELIFSVNTGIVPLTELECFSGVLEAERGTAKLYIRLLGGNLAAHAYIWNFAAKSGGETLDYVWLTFIRDGSSPEKTKWRVHTESARGKTRVGCKADFSKKIPALEITSPNVVLADLEILKSAMATKKSGHKNIMQYAPDAAAFWDIGREWRAEAKIKRLVMHDSAIWENVSADIKVGRSLHADLKTCAFGGRAALEASVDFDESRTLPYSAKFDAKLENADARAAFGKLFSGGKFDAAFSGKSEAANLKNLVKYWSGKIGITCRDGAFAPLCGNSLRASVSSVYDAASTPERKAAKAALVADFAEIGFDTAKIRLERTPQTFNIDIVEFDLRARKMSLKSDFGTLFFNPDLPVRNWDMDVSLRAKTDNERLAELMRTTGALARTESGGEVFESNSFQIYGTLADPQSDAESVLGGAREGRKTIKKTMDILK